MKSLYINTSNQLLEICFKNNDKIVDFISDGKKSQSEEIIDAISSTLNSTKISDLDFIVVNVGPGSFTGIRLGLSVIKGFLIATNTPVICINNFEALYHSLNDKNLPQYNIALNAGGNDCYFTQLDKNGLETIPHKLIKKEEIDLNQTIISDFLNGDNIITAKIDAPKILKYFDKTFDPKTFIQGEIEALYIKPHYAKPKTITSK